MPKEAQHLLTGLFYFFVLCLVETDLKCSPPPKIEHGSYTRNASSYRLNAAVQYHCSNGYYFLGVSSPSQWLYCMLIDGEPTWTLFKDEHECLPPAVLQERCRKKGKHVTISNGRAFCEDLAYGEVSVCNQK